MNVGMSYRKRANRQVCDVDIRYRASGKPFMYFETANTTSVGIESDSVYAMAKSTRRIQFANPLDGTVTITAQVYPSKLFELISGTAKKSSAVYATTAVVACVDEGEIPLSVSSGAEIKAGTVFAYPEGSFGDADSIIPCTFANDKVQGNFLVGHKYEVGFIVTRNTNASTFAFNNKAPLTEYKFTMSTVNKGDDGDFTPFLIVVYRAIMNRNIEVSFSSEGDPAEISMTFTLMPDRKGNMIDMVEIADLDSFQPGDVELPYYIILTDDDNGNVTMTFTNKAVG